MTARFIVAGFEAWRIKPAVIDRRYRKQEGRATAESRALFLGEDYFFSEAFG
jgi:hypothetical protein